MENKESGIRNRNQTLEMFLGDDVARVMCKLLANKDSACLLL